MYILTACFPGVYILTVICNKISKSLKILFQLKPSLCKPSLSNRYSLYLIYSCVFWGNYGGPLSLVIKLQNNALGIIDDVRLMEPITPRCACLNLLKFPDIVKLNTCLLFYDYLNSNVCYFYPNCSVCATWSTCSAWSALVVNESFRSNLRRFCPSVIGRYFRNDIPLEIRHKPSKFV